MSSPKFIKSNPKSTSGVVVSDNSIRMNSGEDNAINVDERGVTINGPMSLVGGTNQIRVGALWTFNNMMALSLPSTIATPTPVLLIDPPAKQLASLMKQAAVMIALLTGAV